MEYLAVSSLEKYQHYKERNMVWFKWHVDSLQDYKFSKLTDSQKWIFIGLICLACKSSNRIPNDIVWITKQISSSKSVASDIARLVDIGLLAVCYQDAIPIREEKIREEKKREEHGELVLISGKTPQKLFGEFWEKYPNKDSRSKSEALFVKSVTTEKDWNDIRIALENYLKMLSSETWRHPQSGKTWFGNWREWINYNHSRAIVVEKKVKKMEIDCAKCGYIGQVDPHPSGINECPKCREVYV